MANHFPPKPRRPRRSHQLNRGRICRGLERLEQFFPVLDLAAFWPMQLCHCTATALTRPMAGKHIFACVGSKAQLVRSSMEMKAEGDVCGWLGFGKGPKMRCGNKRTLIYANALCGRRMGFTLLTGYSRLIHARRGRRFVTCCILFYWRPCNNIITQLFARISQARVRGYPCHISENPRRVKVHRFRL